MLETAVFLIFWIMIVGVACLIARSRRSVAPAELPELTDEQLIQLWLPEVAAQQSSGLTQVWRKALAPLRQNIMDQTPMQEILNAPLTEENIELTVQLTHLVKEHDLKIQDLRFDQFCEMMTVRNILPQATSSR